MLYLSTSDRFLSQDPAGVVGGQDNNLYRYVWNNPLKYVDPTGTTGKTPTEGAGSTGGPILTVGVGWVFNGGGMLGNSNGITMGYQIGVGYDLTTGKFMGFESSGCGNTASGLYGSVGGGVGYSPNSGTLYGTSTVTNLGAGWGASGDLNYGPSGFGVGAPVLGYGYGAGGGTMQSTTNPIGNNFFKCGCQ